ncbi:MAG: fructose-bisphosphate aldolase [Candidatus Nomurabacteria bacterium GW2011_GWB1_37_5]|uniref:Probable fructose-bisphosphate aldolase class 1 n=1 Tax=Candidatus Nomurabacteria bacterium GW2011_GWB1_37_5 TaxID=1618742 RepID=A0A0G0GX84_9BACT|nr:MAG: fructose-bisphosphate aldolase [Candidatus Nomurabacteria bacterium GW2011_GWB1_37_5]
MDKEILIKTVNRLLDQPRGILAIDESLETCNKRFEKLGVPTTEEKRREYRELLITAPEIEKYISGYILFDETIRQSTKDGKSFPSVMQSKGIDVGIKVDIGTKDYPPYPGDKITLGLDGLTERLIEYKKMGATFAKWRAVYSIGENTPSEMSMKENAVALAKYAQYCQSENMVPIVEPEVLIDGDHTIQKCFDVTSHNLDILFNELNALDVYLPGVILKTSMIMSGKDAQIKASPKEVAQMTVKCLKEHVPSNIGGIVFLSGGQDDEEATMHLNLMHQSDLIGDLHWPLTFSYGRAIQNPALKSWAINPNDVVSAQKLLVEAAKNNSLASVGKYKND